MINDDARSALHATTARRTPKGLEAARLDAFSVRQSSMANS
jgi:hypothetical protein